MSEAPGERNIASLSTVHFMWFPQVSTGKWLSQQKNLKCDICRGQHETVLHPAKSPPGDAPAVESTARHAENLTAMGHSGTILPTAVIKVKAKDGHEVAVRCLVVEGSHSRYIAEDLVQKLRLNKREVSGIGVISAGNVSKVVIKTPSPTTTDR